MEVKKRSLENLRLRAITLSEKAEELADQLNDLIEEE